MIPRVSVLMSVYNGEKYLKQAVEGILYQTFTDFEFIIVDDGSTDHTWEILTSYVDRRVILDRNYANLGLSQSLNKALKMAKGEWIARQDSDDISLPERLATQISYLQTHADVGLLGTAYHLVDSQGQCITTHSQPLTDTEIRWQMLFHNAFCHTSVVFRRALVPSGEPFYNERLLYSQDYDLWVRLLARTRGANLAAPLVAFRTHESSTGAGSREEQQRIASDIAAQQISRLLPDHHLGQSEINSLRDWYYRLPEQLSTQDMALCKVIFQILRRLETQHSVDQSAVRSIRRHCFARILDRVRLGQHRSLWTSGLLGAILRDDIVSVVKYVCGRVIRQTGRIARAA